MAELDDKVIVTKNKITTIADTIREEGGTSDLMTLDEMPDNIRAIGGGGNADVKRLGITLANNTATFNLNGYEIWQLIGSNKTIVADITYTDGSNNISYNKSCTASLKSEASDTQTRIEASVMIYKNYTFYTRYFNMVIGASSMEYTGTYAVTDIVIPQEQYVDPLFTLTYPNTITCNKTFADISLYYGAGSTRPVAPQLIYKHSSDDDTAFRSVYGEVEQYDEDTFIFTFNMGYARGVGKTQWQDRIIEIEYASGNLLTKIDDYILEYQKPVVEGDGINITTQGTGINRKSKIAVDSSMIMIGNASGSVASIVDGADDLPLKSCMVAIEPVQSGSGDPSPTNVRPITGRTECNITVADDETTPTISNVYNIEFPSEAGTVYGGTLDVTNGVLTVDRAIIDLGDLNWDKSGNHFYTSAIADVVKTPVNNTTKANIICSNYKTETLVNVYNESVDKSVGIQTMPDTNKGFIVLYDSTYASSSTSEFETAMSGVKLVYELETPITYQLIPIEIKTLPGINNIFADTGDIENVEYTRDATSIINWLISQINLGA